MALVVNSSTPGGAESYLYRLYKGLGDLGLVEVTLVGQLPDWHAGLGPVVAQGTAPKLTRREPLLPQLRKSLSNAVSVRRALGRQEFDLVHMQYFREKLTLGRFFTGRLPVLWTEHGPLPPNFPRWGLPLLRWKARRATIIAVSEAVQTSLADVHISSEVVWNPLPDTAPILAERKEGAFSDYVLYAGRVHRSKRLELLLEAAKELPALKIKIAGNGPDLDELRATAPENVEFLGHLTRLDGLMAGCLAVVSTSGRAAREGSPMVVLEARSLGVPVLMAEDCHAAGEALRLGSHIYQPTPTDLVRSLDSLGNRIQTKPLSGLERSLRSEDRWLRDTYLTMVRTVEHAVDSRSGQ